MTTRKSAVFLWWAAMGFSSRSQIELTATTRIAQLSFSMKYKHLGRYADYAMVNCSKLMTFKSAIN